MTLFIKSLVMMMAAASAQQPTSATPSSPPVVEDAGDFLVVPLQHATAFDISFTVEELLKPRNGPGPSLDEGPTEKTLIVRNFNPAQKENILKMIAMFDIERPEEERDRRPENTPNPRAQNVKVFPLKHAAPASVLESLIPLFKNASLVADSSTNSILVNATNADIAIIEGLLSHLDRASEQSRGSAPGFRAVQIKHRATEEVTKQLMSLLGGMRDRDSRVASDEGRGKIILRGSTEFLEFAEKVISQMDVPAQSIQFEFAFFSADQHSANEPVEPGKIPADLESVAQELQRFGRVRLLGRLACSSIEDRQFLVEGKLGEGLSAKVSGSVINAVSDGSIQLNVKGFVLLNRTPGDPKAPPQSSVFEVNTSVVTLRGDTIMIGSAPAGWNPGESAIMVLQAKQ